MEPGPDSFLRDFVRPLVAGGELHVGRPLDAEDISALEAELVTTTEESLSIELARQAVASELWLYPVPTSLGRDDLALAVALHNLLFMSHPGGDRWWLRSSSQERVRAFTARCLDRPLPRGGEELVARHSLLGRFTDLTRTDVEVRFWAGRRTFQGQQPPQRLMRWRGLRGVREQRHQVRWLATELSEVQRELLAPLLRQSPLTDLLSPQRPFPTFEWLPVARHLTDRHVCRLVCHRYLEQGLEQVGPALAAAFWRLVDSVDLRIPAPEGSRTAVKLVVGLVVYLYALLAMATDRKDHLRVDPAHASEALPAVLMVAARCGLMPGGDALGGAELRERLAEWAGLPAAQLGETANEFTRRLEAALAA